MAKFTVTSPIDHDGTMYRIGDEIELKDAHSAPLLALGHIEPAGKAKKPTKAELKKLGDVVEDAKTALDAEKDETKHEPLKAALAEAEAALNEALAA